MMMIFGSKLRMGHHYLQTWPREKLLAARFPENRVIRALELSWKVVPGLVCVSLLLQLQLGHTGLWPSVISGVLLMLSLPLQGYYWLGVRAETRLPPTLRRWYVEINQKLGAEARRVPQPCYQDLADTLSQAFRRLDASFLMP